MNILIYIIKKRDVIRQGVIEKKNKMIFKSIA